MAEKLYKVLLEFCCFHNLCSSNVIQQQMEYFFRRYPMQIYHYPHRVTSQSLILGQNNYPGQLMMVQLNPQDENELYRHS